MKKVFIFILIILLVTMVFLALDIHQYNATVEALKKVELEFDQTNTLDHDEKTLKLEIKVSGKLPAPNSKIIIFADNRYLELLPDSYAQEKGIKYEGMQAFGVEAIFSIDSVEFEAPGKINIIYAKKYADINEHPLIYAFIETDINRYLLSNATIKSKIFTFKD